MGWVIALLTLLAVVLIAGFGLLIWVVDLGLAQVRALLQGIRDDLQSRRDS